MILFACISDRQKFTAIELAPATEQHHVRRVHVGPQDWFDRAFPHGADPRLPNRHLAMARECVPIPTVLFAVHRRLFGLSRSDAR